MENGNFEQLFIDVFEKTTTSKQRYSANELACIQETLGFNFPDMLHEFYILFGKSKYRINTFFKLLDPSSVTKERGYIIFSEGNLTDVKSKYGVKDDSTELDPVIYEFSCDEGDEKIHRTDNRLRCFLSGFITIAALNAYSIKGCQLEFDVEKEGCRVFDNYKYIFANSSQTTFVDPGKVVFITWDDEPGGTGFGMAYTRNEKDLLAIKNDLIKERML
ncbi:hypothetical protein [Thiolapillus brandeum]|uniref:SMI1/KNR4 family protein n=1 Tax=Thiolapillus brandeum TaxID=1076588 RepID=A0A7U6GG30_9GAMM|nr:hypothetical protein [Thiolapillus brandeum]BAO42973.1 hypothetical protein TBH_C0022 [Thiolapillus brandeum]